MYSEAVGPPATCGKIRVLLVGSEAPSKATGIDPGNDFVTGKPTWQSEPEHQGKAGLKEVQGKGQKCSLSPGEESVVRRGFIKTCTSGRA